MLSSDHKVRTSERPFIHLPFVGDLSILELVSKVFQEFFLPGTLFEQDHQVSAVASCGVGAFRDLMPNEGFSCRIGGHRSTLIITSCFLSCRGAFVPKNALAVSSSESS